ncbi:MAG: Yip1 family protein [Ignavibacteriales bacterium]|nr:Yip1 family protein [Ignavibacteriales bacterium]
MNLVLRAKNIIISPANEWEVIKQESSSVAEMFLKYAVILAAISAVAGFIGFSLFGISLGFISYHVPVASGILWAVLTYVLSLVGVYITALVVDTLAPSFGSTKDMVASLKVVVFAYTPTWVAGILNVIPSLGILVTLASIYSLVLMYMGLQKVKDVPKDKMVGYFLVTLAVTIVIYIIIGIIVSAVAFAGLMSSRYY